MVGYGVLPHTSQLDADQERLQLLEIFGKHRMTVLNTWGKRQTAYEHPERARRLTLVALQQVADSEVKKARLAEWRSSGHLALGS